MRKLTVSTMVSLDSVMEAPGGNEGRFPIKEPFTERTTV